MHESISYIPLHYSAIGPLKFLCVLDVANSSRLMDHCILHASLQNYRYGNGQVPTSFICCN